MEISADTQEDEGLRNYNKFLQKLQATIENECDGSRMSNTKWKEMLDALTLLYPKAGFSYRVKMLDRDKVSRWGWFSYTEHNKPGQVNCVKIEGLGNSPITILAVEYVEIEPNGLYDTGTYWTKMPGGYQNQIERQLDALNVPYTVEDDIIRVTGHVRRLTPPVMVKSRSTHGQW